MSRVTRKLQESVNKFGHSKIGGLHVFVSLFVTPIDRRSSHG